MFKTIKRWMDFSNTIHELNNLTNRELDDIGITRGDIRNIARKNFRR